MDFNKLKNWIAPIDEEEDEEALEVNTQEMETISPVSKYETTKSDIKKVAGDTQVVLFEPRDFSQAEEVGKHLKERRAAVVNLHKLPRDAAQRMIDFLTGVVYAVDGSIQKIGHNVILCTPKNVPVEGASNLNNDED